jgi:hypothetical protein
MSGILGLMNNTCDVYAIVTSSRADSGGVVEQEVIKHNGAPCLIEIAATTRERQIMGRDGVIITHFIYFPEGYEDIVEKDIIKSGGRTYDIQLVDNVQVRDHHLEVFAVVRE